MAWSSSQITAIANFGTHGVLFSFKHISDLIKLRSSQEFHGTNCRLKLKAFLTSEVISVEKSLSRTGPVYGSLALAWLKTQ